MINYYRTLGVSIAASEADLKKAYHSLLLKHHPDKNGDRQKLEEVTKAYAALKNPEFRSKYDIELCLNIVFGDFRKLMDNLEEKKQWIKLSLSVSMGSLVGGLLAMPFNSNISSKLLWTSLTINTYLGYRLLSEIKAVRNQSFRNEHSFFQSENTTPCLQLTDNPQQSLDNLLYQPQ